MVKDRLIELQNLATKNDRNRSRTSTFDSVIRLEDGTPAANVHLLEERDRDKEWEPMDSFLKNVASIREEIASMNVMMKKMKEIHSKILISPGVHPDTTAELNELVTSFKAHSESVSSFVQRMNKEIKRLGGVNDATSRIKRDQANTVTRIFQNVLLEFNNEQIHYKSQCEKKISSYLEIAGLKMDEDEIDHAIESGELFNTVGILMADRDKKVLYEDVKSRHEDILRLEASIRELHEIFQDMAMLVECQGEMVDRIDTNVENAVEYAHNALSNVNHARKSKNRNIKFPYRLYATSEVKNVVETLRSRLYYQSKKRGILENDILIGGFADSKLTSLSEMELREYDKIINGDHMEWDLYYYVTGKKPPPSELFNSPVFQKMCSYVEEIKK